MAIRMLLRLMMYLMMIRYCRFCKLKKGRKERSSNRNAERKDMSIGQRERCVPVGRFSTNEQQKGLSH
uniref:Putative secreted protein n=1 Tax=Anopheles triannulatus TaxID=58253 RepID=A0A2M4B7W1_9DIPT